MVFVGVECVCSELVVVCVVVLLFVLCLLVIVGWLVLGGVVGGLRVLELVELVGVVFEEDGFG